MLNLRRFLVLVGLAAVLFTSGCAVVVNVPITHFDTPESIGDPVRFKVNAAQVAADDVVLTNDYTINAPSIQNPVSIGWAPYVRFGGGISATDRLDIELKGIKAVQAKFQVVGQPRSRAAEGNFSLAALGLIGYESESRTSTGFSNNQTYTLKHSSVPLQLGIIAGYRVTDIALFYVASHFRSTNIEGDYTIGSGPSSHYEGNANAITGNVGFELGTRDVQLTLEAGYGQIKAGTLTKNELNVGLQAAFMFGGKRRHEEPISPTPIRAALND